MLFGDIMHAVYSMLKIQTSFNINIQKFRHCPDDDAGGALETVHERAGRSSQDLGLSGCSGFFSKPSGRETGGCLSRLCRR
jgi:hypothetical protein